MKRCYLRIRAIIQLFILVGSAVLCSCQQEKGPDITPPGKGMGYMRLYLNLPELRNPDPNPTGIRAMNNHAESAISEAQLQVLVFKSDGSATETFYYKASVSGSVTYDANDPTKAVVIVTLVKSENTNDRYRIVVVANHNLSGITMTENVTGKEEILNQLIYSVPDKWNADAAGYTPFPMWGESESPVIITDRMSLEGIDLHRALARIDIGLDMESVNGQLTESAHGLDHFSLKEVYLYRTYSQGYVAPQHPVHFPPVPSIPAGAVRRADQAPLHYLLPGNMGTDRYVREIYIPEAEIPASPTNRNVHCVVVGGYYRGNRDITYYRLDFAYEDEEGERFYRPVLRNHRYVFNITQVRGPGFLTPQEALQSVGSVGNLGYDLVVWNESILWMEVKGKYYFGLNAHRLHLNRAANDVASVSYQTNLPVTEPMTFEWEKGASSPFQVTGHDPVRRMVTIATREENITNQMLTDRLFIQSGPFTFSLFTVQHAEF